MHHANLVIGKDCKNMVLHILQEHLNFKTQANPDFILVESQSFGIAEARELEKWAIGKPFMGETKAALVIAKSITHESQNALLKTLEEPTPGTYIFINLESLGGLLPTLLSRVRLVSCTKDFDGYAKKEKSLLQKEAMAFLHSNIGERLSLVQDLSKEEDKTSMRDFIDCLESAMYANGFKDKQGHLSKADALKKILAGKIFASARGSSPKMLLEWLSCVL